jgi:hypothetical protein
MKAKTVTRVTKGKTKAASISGGGKKGGETMVEFTPERSLPLTFDGKTIEVQAGVKTTLPPHYKAIYDAAS